MRYVIRSRPGQTHHEFSQSIVVVVGRQDIVQLPKRTGDGRATKLEGPESLDNGRTGGESDGSVVFGLRLRDGLSGETSEDSSSEAPAFGSNLLPSSRYASSMLM
eukprot:CAMPEP_0177545640 /NCGR_PEP_ID=MMETSP0369-20130122/62733_1 /TAXON_ID=447022 ORGANISM="Scrippsiella hangoei-like, Strain SHHI-4" /NCGR_SAMPLE_ID=MMETSP0369 /ASSEMBLY_ACC=CAM_ASM_000364 /LENGTH=104 /DNA_ID=CAMNT_0019029961 /DNA_START=6 /DNA_END=321 /DNA_ORIENTATION=+